MHPGSDAPSDTAVTVPMADAIPFVGPARRAGLAALSAVMAAACGGADEAPDADAATVDTSAQSGVSSEEASSRRWRRASSSRPHAS